jgi:hypothetical protein
MLNQLTDNFSEDCYLYAVVVATFAPLVYILYSFWTKTFIYSSANINMLIILTIILFLFPLGGVAVLTWEDGNRTSVTLVVSILLILPFYGGPRVHDGWIFVLPGIPVLTAFMIIGIEWIIRRQELVFDFFRSKIGLISIAFSLVHVIFGLALQYYSRSGFTPAFYLPHVPFFVILGLFSAVVLPVYLWKKERLYMPSAVVIAWVIWGLLDNYLWWDSYPITELYALGSVSYITPAPDYGVKFFVPLTVMMSVAVVELAYRKGLRKNVHAD